MVTLLEGGVFPEGLIAAHLSPESRFRPGRFENYVTLADDAERAA